MRPALQPRARLHRAADHGLRLRIRLPPGPLRRGGGAAPDLLRADRHAAALGARPDPARPARRVRAGAAGDGRQRSGWPEPRPLPRPRRRTGPAPGRVARRARDLGAALVVAAPDPDRAGPARHRPDPGPGAGRPGRHRPRSPSPVPADRAALRRPGRAAAGAGAPRGGALHAGLHAGLCGPAAARPLDAAGDPGAGAAQCRHRRLPDGPARRRDPLPGERAAGPRPLRLRDRAAALRAVPGLPALPLGADPAGERDLRDPGSHDARLLRGRRDLGAAPRRGRGADRRHRPDDGGGRRVLAGAAPVPAHRRPADPALRAARTAGRRGKGSPSGPPGGYGCARPTARDSPASR